MDQFPEDIRKKQRVEQYKWTTGQNATITKMLDDPTMSDPIK